MKLLKNILKNYKSLGMYLLAGVVILILLIEVSSWASDTSEFSQTISAGTLSVDIVDGSGNPVASPSVSFGLLSFSFATNDGSGALGTATEKIRAYNPTLTDIWTVNIAANSGNTAVWDDGSNTYDFNDSSGYTDGGDADSVGGELEIDPSGGTLTGVGICTTTNVSLGTSDFFDEGLTDNIDLMSASAGSDTSCSWDLTGVDLDQKIPAGQAAGTYTLDMTLTIS